MTVLNVYCSCPVAVPLFSTVGTLPHPWLPADLHGDAACAVIQTLGRFMASYFTNQPLYIRPPHHVASLPPLHLSHCMTPYFICLFKKIYIYYIYLSHMLFQPPVLDVWCCFVKRRFLERCDNSSCPRCGPWTMPRTCSCLEGFSRKRCGWLTISGTGSRLPLSAWPSQTTARATLISLGSGGGSFISLLN